MALPALFTIGYEGSTVASVGAALREAGVRVLLDVRAVPLSRKPGFSKRMLASVMAEQGIEYVHLRGLGTPAEGRLAARAGKIDRMHVIFRAHMESDQAQADLAHAVVIAGERPACLLCFEHAASGCHRRIVGEMISGRSGQSVVDLVPG